MININNLYTTDPALSPAPLSYCCYARQAGSSIPHRSKRAGFSFLADDCGFCQLQ